MDWVWISECAEWAIYMNTWLPFDSSAFVMVYASLLVNKRLCLCYVHYACLSDGMQIPKVLKLTSISCL